MSQLSNCSSQPMSLCNFEENTVPSVLDTKCVRPPKYYNCIGELRSVEEIPQKYRHIFSAYPCFNKVQSRVMDDSLYSNKSLVVSSPTGSGKTVIFELAIIQYLLHLEDMDYHGDYKILYLAPMKALCSERLLDWHSKFSPLGIKLIEVTGDSESFEFSHLSGFNLILSTPEKWDSITRRWKGNRALVQVVKLILIDEVQLLNEDKRGPILEAVVSRMKTVQELMQHQRRMEQLRATQQTTQRNDIQDNIQNMRFVAISATIPNIEDIAMWLGEHGNSAIFHKMGEELRPVKLNRVVLGYPFLKEASAFKFEIALSYRIMPIIGKYSGGKPTLIFVSTRNAAKLTSSALQKLMTVKFTGEQLEIIVAACVRILDNNLREMLRTGVAYHHAGMAIDDRRIIEELFRNGDLPVLVATNTLAMGVNLPARLVIVKGTTLYRGGETKQYSTSAVLQMIGRAGRPQFDTTATAVIMTSQTQVKRYEALLSGSELIESWLHKHLGEHLNAEVVLGTIFDLTVALQWVRTTFLYVRAVRNPMHYGLAPGLNKAQVEKKLEELCHIEMNALAKYDLLKLESEYGMNVTPTATGKLMSRYYLQFESMKVFQQVNPTAQLEDILNLLSRCKEYDQVTLRMGERSLLNTLNRPRGGGAGIRFPIPGLIQSAEKKINCLLQAILGSKLIANPSLNQEALSIKRTAERVATCLTEYLLLMVNGKSYLPAFYSSLILAKCLQAGIWENSSHVIRQLPGIGPTLSGLLVSAYKDSFKKIAGTNPRDIERILNKAPPFGNDIVDRINQLPKFILTVTRQEKSVHVEVRVENKSFTAYVETCVLVGDSFNNVLMYETKIDRNIEPGFSWSKTAALKTLQDSTITVRVISRSWVGLDVEETLKIGNGAPLPSPVVPTPSTSKINTKTTKPKKTIAMSVIDKLIPPKTTAKVATRDNISITIPDLIPQLKSSQMHKQLKFNSDKYNALSNNNCRVNTQSVPLANILQQNFNNNQNKQELCKSSDFSNQNVSQLKRNISQVNLQEEAELDQYLIEAADVGEILADPQKLPYLDNRSLTNTTGSKSSTNCPKRNTNSVLNITHDQSFENTPKNASELASLINTPKIKSLVSQWNRRKQHSNIIRNVFEENNSRYTNIHDSGYSTTSNKNDQNMNSSAEERMKNTPVVHKSFAEFAREQDNKMRNIISTSRTEESIDINEKSSNNQDDTILYPFNQNSSIDDQILHSNLERNNKQGFTRIDNTSYMNKIQNTLNNTKNKQSLDISLENTSMLDKSCNRLDKQLNISSTHSGIRNSQTGHVILTKETSANSTFSKPSNIKTTISVTSRTQWSGSLSKSLSMRNQNNIKELNNLKLMSSEFMGKNLKNESNYENFKKDALVTMRNEKFQASSCDRMIDEILNNAVRPEAYIESKQRYSKFDVSEGEKIGLRESSMEPNDQLLRSASKIQIDDEHKKIMNFGEENQLNKNCMFNDRYNRNIINHNGRLHHQNVNNYSKSLSNSSRMNMDSSLDERRNNASSSNYTTDINYQANKLAEEARRRRNNMSMDLLSPSNFDYQGKYCRLSESQIFARRGELSNNDDDSTKVREVNELRQQEQRDLDISRQMYQSKRYEVPVKRSKWACYLENSPGNDSPGHDTKLLRLCQVNDKSERNFSSSSMPRMKTSITEQRLHKSQRDGYGRFSDELSNNQIRIQNEIVQKHVGQYSSRRPLIDVDANIPLTKENRFPYVSSQPYSSYNERDSGRMRITNPHGLNRENAQNHSMMEDNRREDQRSKINPSMSRTYQGIPSLQQFKYRSSGPKLPSSQVDPLANKTTSSQDGHRQRHFSTAGYSYEEDNFRRQTDPQYQNVKYANVNYENTSDRKCYEKEYYYDPNSNDDDLNTSDYNLDEAQIRNSISFRNQELANSNRRSLSSYSSPDSILERFQPKSSIKGISIMNIEKVDIPKETIRQLLRGGNSTESIKSSNNGERSNNINYQNELTSTVAGISNDIYRNNPNTNYDSSIAGNSSCQGQKYRSNFAHADNVRVNHHRKQFENTYSNIMDNSDMENINYAQTDAYKLNSDMQQRNESSSRTYDHHQNSQNGRNIYPDRNSQSDDLTNTDYDFMYNKLW